MIQSAYAQVKTDYNFDFELKQHQTDVIRHILQKEDVFAILPTGYGKSLCYVLPPLMLDKVVVL